MKKIMGANALYRDLRGRRDTRVVIKEPEINGFGFSVDIHEQIGQDSARFKLKLQSACPVAATKDMAAAITGALVLQKYHSIHFDFDVGENTLREIKDITGVSRVYARKTREDDARSARSQWSMGYSGGLDSTALHLICPDITPVSINFTDTENNPAAEDEHKMFGWADAAVVETNAHEFLFPRYSTGYYNLGSLLLSDTKGIALAADGKIMSDDWKVMHYLEGDSGDVYHALRVPRSVYSVQTVYPMIGFTKIGVQKAAAKLKFETYERVLRSSVGGARRRARALLLIDRIITGKARPVKWAAKAEQQEEEIPVWGANPLQDFYTLYFINRLGAGEASGLADGVPQEAADLAVSLKLDFYEKYDPRALKDAPPDFAGHFLDHLQEFGVELYNGDDYEERSKIFNLLQLAAPPGFSEDKDSGGAA